MDTMCWLGFGGGRWPWWWTLRVSGDPEGTAVSSTHHGSRVPDFQLLLCKFNPYRAPPNPSYTQLPLGPLEPLCRALGSWPPHTSGQLFHI